MLATLAQEDIIGLNGFGPVVPGETAGCILHGAAWDFMF